jgi:hypothetical protein
LSSYPFASVVKPAIIRLVVPVAKVNGLEEGCERAGAAWIAQYALQEIVTVEARKEIRRRREIAARRLKRA